MTDVPRGEWRKSAGRHLIGDEYWLGRIKVGSAFYALRPRGEPTRYQAAVDLPGIKIREEAALAPTVDEAKAVVERVVATWFARLNQTREPA